MTEKQNHFDEDLGPKVSDKFSTDLKALFKSDTSVPPKFDEAVINRAYRHLTRRNRPLRILRWAAPAAAAAAVIIFVFLLEPLSKVSLTDSPSVLAAAPADVDLNGRIDILDAFKLARYIKSAEPIETKWDINGDGSVNNDDVDSVAFAAVRLDKGIL